MISLRHFTEADAEIIRQKHWTDLSTDEIVSIINDWKSLEYEGKYFEMFAIVVDDMAVGYISLMEHSQSIVSLGIEIFSDKRQKGYATRAMALASEIAAKRGYKAIQNQVHTDNMPSIALHEKCEYETDGYVYMNQKGKEIGLYTYFLC